MNDNIRAMADRLAVLRAVTTGDNAHSSSGYAMMTGVPLANVITYLESIQTE